MKEYKNEYIMNRESLKRHCEAMCHKFMDVPTSGTYGEHRLVLDLLEQTRWIPVSERLPELGRRVLCQCQANIYDVLKLTVDGWYYDQNHCYMENFVIAWMPLPKPYKGE